LRTKSEFSQNPGKVTLFSWGAKMKIFKILVLPKKQNIKNTLISNDFFLVIHKNMAENAEEIMKILLIDFMIWALCWRHTSK
jgi:hypothetical protein